MNAENYITHCDNKGVFKRMQKNHQEELKHIVKHLCKMKNAVRASEIADNVKLDAKVVTSRLKRLKKHDLLNIKGANMKYVRDAKNNTAVFPGNIDQLVKQHLGGLWEDALERGVVLEIIVSVLENNFQTESLHELITKLKYDGFLQPQGFIQQIGLYIDNKNLLNFYSMVYDEISRKNLYLSECHYGDLNWQCRAHRYELKPL